MCMWMNMYLFYSSCAASARDTWWLTIWHVLSGVTAWSVTSLTIGKCMAIDVTSHWWVTSLHGQWHHEPLVRDVTAWPVTSFTIGKWYHCMTSDITNHWWVTSLAMQWDFWKLSRPRRSPTLEWYVQYHATVTIIVINDIINNVFLINVIIINVINVTSSVCCHTTK